MPRVREILLVDDDEAVREAVADVLRDEGCRVYQAANGAEALRILDVFRPDLIITDLMMPRMDGWTFCANIKSNPLTKATPVAVLTAFADMTPPPGVRTIRKPVNIRALTELLAFVA